MRHKIVNYRWSFIAWWLSASYSMGSNLILLIKKVLLSNWLRTITLYLIIGQWWSIYEYYYFFLLLLFLLLLSLLLLLLFILFIIPPSLLSYNKIIIIIIRQDPAVQKSLGKQFSVKPLDCDGNALIKMAGFSRVSVKRDRQRPNSVMNRWPLLLIGPKVSHAKGTKW